ncbi:MAG: hypothetical protein JRI36_05355, partial [Deltaproteobacteria bacterium]|nr:hypothetical protein [Deltaproteobacteria bacterium]
IDLALVMLVLVLIRQVKGLAADHRIPDAELFQRLAEPVLQESKALAEQFETQLKQKQNIVRKLNQALDDRIMGLNLLLNRAETCLKSPVQDGFSGKDIARLRNQVMALSAQGLSAEQIAADLGVAKGEVALVLDLKKKARAQTDDVG